MARLEQDFFAQDTLTVARQLVGKVLVHQTPEGEKRLRITETEAYIGEGDTACHAHKGRTRRTETMYGLAGTVYIYLCYGMHWMANIVTGAVNDPQAVLIRACETAEGPARLTKALGITGDLNCTSVLDAENPLWLEDDGFACDVYTDTRVGIGYASAEDQARPWRFCMVRETPKKKRAKRG